MPLRCGRGILVSCETHLGEDIKELALADVAVEVANVQGGVVLRLIGILPLRPRCCVVCHCGCHSLWFWEC